MILSCFRIAPQSPLLSVVVYARTADAVALYDRLLEGNRYWVSAAFVNGAPGFVHKDYELRIGAQ